jgi:hypothetical protein
LSRGLDWPAKGREGERERERERERLTSASSQQHKTVAVGRANLSGKTSDRIEEAYLTQTPRIFLLSISFHVRPFDGAAG